MSLDSQRPGLPWSTNQTRGQRAGRSVQPIIILQVLNQAVCGGQQDPVCLSFFFLSRLKSRLTMYPINLPQRCLSQDRLPCCQFLLCDPFHLPVPLTHFAHWKWGFGKVFERRIKLSLHIHSGAAWFNAGELGSQHLFGLMLQPWKKKESLGRFKSLFVSVLVSYPYQVRCIRVTYL